jgi:hypothetical protein
VNSVGVPKVQEPPCQRFLYKLDASQYPRAAMAFRYSRTRGLVSRLQSLPRTPLFDELRRDAVMGINSLQKTKCRPSACAFLTSSQPVAATL